MTAEPAAQVRGHRRRRALVEDAIVDDPGAFGALFQVIMIDLVLAGDNAVVIGLAAAGLPHHMRRKAIVMGAFTNYRLGNYDDAIGMAKRYLTLYSSSEDAPYAQYIIGLSYYRQIKDVTQDQTEARQTMQTMQDLVNRWPDSEYVEDAKAKIRFANDQLAGKEMQVGRYYLERREYLAAIKRFRTVVENYSDTRQVEEALARLTEAYYAMGLTDEAQTAAAVLGHNYPDSPWYKDSYKLLQSNGLEPRENAGSWISKAGKLITGA